MNLSPEWVSELAADGHDVVHWREIGDESAPDQDIIAWAAETERAVLTADLGFGATVARRGLAAPTIVQLRLGSTDPRDASDQVRSAIRAAAPQLSGGAILTIYEDRARLRRDPRIELSMDDE